MSHREEEAEENTSVLGQADTLACNHRIGWHSFRSPLLFQHRGNENKDSHMGF